MLADELLTFPDPGPPPPTGQALCALMLHRYREQVEEPARRRIAAHHQGTLRPTPPAPVQAVIELPDASRVHAEVRQPWPGLFLLRTRDGQGLVSHTRFGSQPRRRDVTGVSSGEEPVGAAVSVAVQPGPLGRVTVSLPGGEVELRVLQAAVLTSPAPALVVRELVEPGQTVCAGDPVLVVESMKLETTLTAPADGHIQEIAVTAGDCVDPAARLLTVMPPGAIPSPPPSRPSMSTKAAAQDATSPEISRTWPPAEGLAAADALDVLRGRMLGFDVTLAEARQARAVLQLAARPATPDLPDLDSSPRAGVRDLLALVELGLDIGSVLGAGTWPGGHEPRGSDLFQQLLIHLPALQPATLGESTREAHLRACESLAGRTMHPNGDGRPLGTTGGASSPVASGSLAPVSALTDIAAARLLRAAERVEELDSLLVHLLVVLDQLSSRPEAAPGQPGARVRYPARLSRALRRIQATTGHSTDLLRCARRLSYRDSPALPAQRDGSARQDWLRAQLTQQAPRAAHLEPTPLNDGGLVIRVEAVDEAAHPGAAQRAAGARRRLVVAHAVTASPARGADVSESPAPPAPPAHAPASDLASRVLDAVRAGVAALDTLHADRGGIPTDALPTIRVEVDGLPATTPAAPDQAAHGRTARLRSEDPADLHQLLHRVGEQMRAEFPYDWPSLAVQVRVVADSGRAPVASWRHLGQGILEARTGEDAAHWLAPPDPAEQRRHKVRTRGLVDPDDLLTWLTRDGSLTRLDLNESGHLVPTGPDHRATSAIVCAEVCTPTRDHPEGVRRVALAGDPSKALGAIGEAECAVVEAALERAADLDVPLEWYALSAGAVISRESGTENMDGVARVLRRLITFTQDGGEINVVVCGINVGAQPYWNAEATMLMHTRGILIMTPVSSMVLTGKRSLDYSGSTSASSEDSIGGYRAVMGPNGQAQYFAHDLAAAVGVLEEHYDFTYRPPHCDRVPDRVSTDADDRDVSTARHQCPGTEATTVGEVLSAAGNPHRKQPFDIRTIMRAVADSDREPLERWKDMDQADGVVVMDARLGGVAVCAIGIESRPRPRHGAAGSDGPPAWTSGTLFPHGSRKAARALNAASGNRPVVVLANLAGFDGSPESMRERQLEFGAEIGRAVVNFRGPIVFCVLGRYHGGAFVVFSKELNPNLRVLAVDGARASVIGGAPAANVVFAAATRKSVAADPGLAALHTDLAAAPPHLRALLSWEAHDLQRNLTTRAVEDAAHDFDAIHDLARAVRVGSVDQTITPDRLRPELIAALRHLRDPAT